VTWALVALVLLAGCRGGSEAPGESGSAEPGEARLSETSGSPQGAEEATRTGSVASPGRSEAWLEGWSGTLLSAEAVGSPGVSVAPAGGVATAATLGAAIPRGATVRTDAQTRAVLKMSDGGVVVLDRGSELELRTDQPRAA